jgi:hypothetical protein
MKAVFNKIFTLGFLLTTVFVNASSLNDPPPPPSPPSPPGLPIDSGVLILFFASIGLGYVILHKNIRFKKGS